MPWLVPAVILPIGVGYLVTLHLWPTGTRWHSQLALKMSLAGGLGMGIGSGLFFLWMLLFTPSGHGLIVLETAVLGAAIGFLLLLLRIRKDSSRISESPGAASGNGSLPWISIGFYLCAALATYALVNIMLRHPHGGWDAWAIWNMRARFLFRSADEWQVAFSALLGWSHPDYPLLLPAMVARCWKYVGYETVAAPMTVAAVFFLGTLGVAFSSVSALVTRGQAVVAGLCVIGTHMFVFRSATQYADVSGRLFFLAAVVLFALHDRQTTRQPGLLVLAGVMTGLAAWTKNEGILFIIAIVIARLAVGVRAKSVRSFFREMGTFFVGLAPIAVMLAVFKTHLAPENDILALLRLQTALSKLVDWSRYREVLEAFAKQMIQFGDGLVGILVVYALLLGWNVRKGNRTPLMGSLITLGVMLGGYFFVYIITLRI